MVYTNTVTNTSVTLSVNIILVAIKQLSNFSKLQNLNLSQNANSGHWILISFYFFQIKSGNAHSHQYHRCWSRQQTAVAVCRCRKRQWWAEWPADHWAVTPWPWSPAPPSPAPAPTALRWASGTTKIMQIHVAFDECLTPQQSYNFTLCWTSVWHHNNHANLHSDHWASGLTPIMQIHTEPQEL